MTARFEETRYYHCDRVQLMEKSKKVLQKCKFRIKEVDETNGIIYAKTNVSFWSWTEEIEVRVEDNGNVTMKSQCYLPTQILDWGKNKSNVRKFFKKLGIKNM